MEHLKDDEMLKSEVQTMYSIHLGIAVDEMHEAAELMKKPNESHNALRARRFTLSSILHAFCSLEALVNYLGYNRFSYSDSENYLSAEKREYLLNRQLQRWDKLKLIEKINLLFLSYEKEVLDKNLESRISELNILRNWIAHGKTYHTVSLIEPMPTLPPGQGYFIVDEEISVKWKGNFPHCKFKEPHYLDHEDAKTALRIIIEVYQILSLLTGQHFFFETYYPSLIISGLCGDSSSNIDAILRI